MVSLDGSPGQTSRVWEIFGSAQGGPLCGARTLIISLPDKFMKKLEMKRAARSDELLEGRLRRFCFSFFLGIQSKYS